ncbi:MAG: NAD-dependent epimerase/dehydratase family protein [Nitrospirota bacterium]
MPERILVTGAGGFLGSHICAYFGQRGHSIAALDKFSPAHLPVELYPNLAGFFEISLPDSTFATILRQFEPSLLIHCAGSASVPYSLQQPYDDFQQSAGVTAFVLEMLRAHMSSCHFVFLSSAAVYGNPEVLPVQEDTACRPISPYGYHKQICELLCGEYASLFGIQSSILRIFSAYGERLRKQVVFDLCRKFSDPTQERVEIFGTGEETRDFIHAIDIAQSVEHIQRSGASGVFNIASGRQTRISELAGMVKDCFGSHKSILYSGTSRSGDPLFWQADISRIASLGFRQEISLEQGIREYCRWFESEYVR